MAAEASAAKQWRETADKNRETWRAAGLGTGRLIGIITTSILLAGLIAGVIGLIIRAVLP